MRNGTHAQGICFASSIFARRIRRRMCRAGGERSPARGISGDIFEHAPHLINDKLESGEYPCGEVRWHGSPISTHNDLHRIVMRQGAPIGSVMAQSVIRVADRPDLRQKQDRLASQCVRISHGIISLMVIEGDLSDEHCHRVAGVETRGPTHVHKRLRDSDGRHLSPSYAALSAPSLTELTYCSFALFGSNTDSMLAILCLLAQIPMYRRHPQTGRLTIFIALGPVHTRSAVECWPPGSLRDGSRQMRILLIDDDLGVRLLLRKMLNRAGHEVTEGEHAFHGIAEIRNSKFDLILTDIIMPLMNGIEFIKLARQLSPSSKVIAMSGGGRTGSGDLLKTAWEHGASALLPKPFTAADVLASIDQCFSAAAMAGRA
jgi:CheY-like chemotaxis protein